MVLILNFNTKYTAGSYVLVKYRSDELPALIEEVFHFFGFR